MVEGILQLARQGGYDFRKTAYSNDPLQYLFDDWEPSYRLKWAIARVLQPKTILELGVRYGYSALAFLDASPEARYLGIDADSNQSGSEQGAIYLARSATRQYNAEFLIADTQRMDSLPGGRYDLIHVHRRQEVTCLLHDLELAIGQGRYVLMDGYFCVRDNFLAVSEYAQTRIGNSFQSIEPQTQL